jgi:3-hydroxybutyryl-CoA dehydratase
MGAREFTAVTDTITQRTIDDYAELSGDFNPLHVDQAVAAASEFGGTIAHGPIALQAFFRSMTAWLGVQALPPGMQVKVTYRHPVRPGDSVTCELRERSQEGTDTVIAAECVNQDGTTVISIAAVFAY